MKKCILFSFLSLSIFGLAAVGVVGFGNSTSLTPVKASTPDLIIDSDQDMIDFIDHVNTGVPSGTDHSAQTYYGKTVSLEADVSISLTKQPTNDATNKLYSFFSGTFEGNNHTITINYESSDIYCALFRNLQGVVRNLNIDGTFNVGSYSATICVNNNGTIQNVNNYAVLSPDNSIIGFGGIVYNTQSNSKIINCNNYANITSKGRSAGIAVYVVGASEVTNCNNYGNVTANYKDVSNNAYCSGVISILGAAGVTDVHPKLTNCSNFGSITSTNLTSKFSTGGVVAWAYGNGIIDKCSNFGTVTGSGYGTGGLVGICKESTFTIQNCYSGGDVISKRASNPYCGGVIGHVGDSNTGYLSIINTVSTAKVSFNASGAEYIGKIIGSNPKRVTTSQGNFLSFGNFGGSGTVKAEVILTEGVTTTNTELTDNAKAIIKYVRLFSCQKDYPFQSDLITALNNLTLDDSEGLSLVTYYDINGYTNQSYLSAANYIAHYNLDMLNQNISYKVINGNNGSTILLISILVCVGFSSLALLFLKKKHNR